MTTELKIAALNYDIIWNDIRANLNKIGQQLENVEADLIVLPEMFSTGFSMKPGETADKDETTLQWMKNWSSNAGKAICGSVSVSESGKYFNRLYFVEPDGNVQFYDKRHLFSFSGEHEVYTTGKERVIVNFKGWRLLLQICYDLRFPVFARNTGDYDAVIYVANWPDSRINAWEILLKARAVENQCYVFGVNRTGKDGNNLVYPESSWCFFADGSLISHQSGNLVTAVFEAEKLAEFRARFLFLNDRDTFTVF